MTFDPYGKALSRLFYPAWERFRGRPTFDLLRMLRRKTLRVGSRWLPAVLAVGLCDVAANALFALASGRGLLALVSVLGSLYPVMTVLLAFVVLHERLTRVQLAGIGVALAGVAALSAG